MTTGTTLERYEVIVCAALAVAVGLFTTLLFAHVLFSAPMVA
ncbi:MAG TPA: hypothetical protein PL152_10845 [Steroidobacteraceae bacterium]|nr:hypothetical protein [Steroidobacteraceae bacterium]HQR49824.1 hypothetical protein [Steroidobacteraceae bacterium]